MTNTLGLPEPLAKAAARDDYDRGKSDLTVTELLKPPRVRALEIRHMADIVEDVKDRLWLLFGQIGHLILERASMDEYVERRFYWFEPEFKKLIGGKADLILKPGNTAKLIDYKFCSHYTVKDGIKPEWTAQINMLRVLAFEDAGLTIDEAEIVAIYWPESVKHGNVKEPATVFPFQHPDGHVSYTAMMQMPATLWPIPAGKDFIRERIKLHLDAEKELPLCTDEERWTQPAVFAVMKKGRKSAVRLWDTFELASIHRDTDPGLYIEERPAVYKRCERYCSAAAFCSQFHPEVTTTNQHAGPNKQ